MDFPAYSMLTASPAGRTPAAPRRPRPKRRGRRAGGRGRARGSPGPRRRRARAKPAGLRAPHAAWKRERASRKQEPQRIEAAVEHVERVAHRDALARGPRVLEVVLEAAIAETSAAGEPARLVEPAQRHPPRVAKRPGARARSTRRALAPRASAKRAGPGA